MDFRIRQLQCFLTLSDLLNYGKTARALYMSQPTITFQIKSLEETFGVKLFERDRQQVRLTDAGCAFREYAQSIMDTVDAAGVPKRSAYEAAATGELRAGGAVHFAARGDSHAGSGVSGV